MNAAKRIRVLLADDHRMVAEGLKSLLAAEVDLVRVVEDGVSLVEAARELRPDLIIADISMPHLNGLDALERLKQDNADVRVIFLTMHQEVAYARRALEAGASAYVLKHSAPAELIKAIRAAMNGRTFVTPTLAGEVLRAMKHGPEESDPAASISPSQRTILKLMSEGLSAKEIGARLSLSSRTVEFHKYRMMETLGMRTSAELLLFAIKEGIVTI